MDSNHAHEDDTLVTCPRCQQTMLHWQLTSHQCPAPACKCGYASPAIGDTCPSCGGLTVS